MCRLARGSRESEESLCSPSRRRRLALSAAHASLSDLLAAGSSGGSEGEAPPPSTAEAASALPGVRAPTALSVQVRALRSGGADEALQLNMLNAFASLMEQLNKRYSGAAARAPAGFEERINFWHAECGMSAALQRDMHTLRVWSNAARHHDRERWRRDGPRSAHEASQLLADIDATTCSF